MTAPRDPIEALRDALGCGSSVNHTLWHERMTLLDEVLAEARDEGRQEAVREIRERLNEAAIDMRGWQDRNYRYIPEYKAATILDDVARHGRSSAPEPVPPAQYFHPLATMVGEFARDFVEPGPGWMPSTASTRC